MTLTAKRYYASLSPETVRAFKTIVHLAVDEAIIEQERTGEGRQETLERLVKQYVDNGSPELLERIYDLVGLDAGEELDDFPGTGSGDRETRIAALRKISGRLAEPKNGTGTLDRAKHAMDAAERKHRRLTGAAYMSDADRHAWRQRHLSREERHALAMDESNRESDFNQMFPEAARFLPGHRPSVVATDSERSPPPPAGSFEAIRAETLAMLDQIRVM
jgi:hypothetical protein